MQHHSEHSLPWQWYTYSMRSHVSVGLIFFYIYRFTCFIFLLFFLPFIFEFISPPLFLFICYYLRYIHPPPSPLLVGLFSAQFFFFLHSFLSSFLSSLSYASLSIFLFFSFPLFLIIFFFLPISGCAGGVMDGSLEWEIREFSPNSSRVRYQIALGTMWINLLRSVMG